MNRSDYVLIYSFSFTLKMKTQHKYCSFIRYLAAGISMRSISYLYRLGLSTVSYTIKNTCTAIWEALNSEYLGFPTENMWKIIAEGFHSKWNFPNCAGAIDGKHIRIQVV